MSDIDSSNINSYTTKLIKINNFYRFSTNKDPNKLYNDFYKIYFNKNQYRIKNNRTKNNLQPIITLTTHNISEILISNDYDWDLNLITNFKQQQNNQGNDILYNIFSIPQLNGIMKVYLS